MRDNIEVVWAKFSTLSLAVLFQSNVTAWHSHTATSRVKKSVQVSSCGLYCKCFMIVIYDRNDSGQYYKTKITIVIDDPS